MKVPHRLLTFVMGVILIAAPLSAGYPKFLDAVRPLTIKTIDPYTEELVERNICTVTNINKKLHYWLTAHHCIANGSYTYFIDGMVAPAVMEDADNDLAILYTESTIGQSVKLAKKGPGWSDVVLMAVHPLGYRDLFLTRGHVANPRTVHPDYMNDRHFMLLDMTGAPGNSGSAVLNGRGEIVSVLQIGWGREFTGMMGGVPFDVLKNHWIYFER